MVSTSSTTCLDPRAPAARPLTASRRVNNVCAALGFRTRGLTSNDSGALLRVNLQILRNIILQDGAEFTKVWTKSSKSVISYECGRIYFENYRICYSSLTPWPQLLYELPKQSKAEKTEDSLLCQCPLEKVLSQASEQKPSLLALTANNWLYRISADTGETLQRIYLSPHFRFRSLSWNISQETFYVKSVQHKQTRLAQQAGINNNIVLHLAIFTVFPVEVVGHLEISKKVFGKTAVDVDLYLGVLAVSHSTKCTKMYSFEYVLKKFRTKELVLGQQCDSNGVLGIVGDAPFGIPVNIQIKECPPVLIEMSSFDNGIQIGGYPWHYIYTPNHKRYQGTHHICSARDGTLAKNGVQEMKCDSLEADWILFHPDASGRIIHACPSTINVLKIRPEAEFDSQYEVVQDFSVNASRDSSSSSKVTVTSSGRTVKSRFQQLDDDPEQETFVTVNYEDELDLLTIVDVGPTEEDVGQANVRLHDNSSGAVMKKITLKEPWDVTYSHEVTFDRDTIIHINKEKNNFSCHVYKLNRRKN